MKNTIYTHFLINNNKMGGGGVTYFTFWLQLLQLLLPTEGQEKYKNKWQNIIMRVKKREGG